MKVSLQSVNAKLISSVSREFRTSSGGKGMAYKINVESAGGDVAELLCSEEAYQQSLQISKYNPVMFVAEYDTNYKNLRVIYISDQSKK